MTLTLLIANVEQAALLELGAFKDQKEVVFRPAYQLEAEFGTSGMQRPEAALGGERRVSMQGNELTGSSNSKRLDHSAKSGTDAGHDRDCG